MATAAFKGESPFNGILEREHHESDFKWVFERNKKLFEIPGISGTQITSTQRAAPLEWYFSFLTHQCSVSIKIWIVLSVFFSAWFHSLFIIALQAVLKKALSKLEMNLAFFDRREMAALLYHQVTLALFGLGRAGSIHLANILARCRSAHQCLAVHKQWGQMHTIDCTIQVHKI